MARVIATTAGNISMRLVTVILAVLCISPVALLAGEFKLLRLASELHSASTQLADELRNTRGQGNVRFHAERLSRKTVRLMKVIQDGRGHAHLRSEFTAISRRYQSLENAFLRANLGIADPLLSHSLSLISLLHGNLNREYYSVKSLESISPVYHRDASINSRRALPAVFSGRSYTYLNRSPYRRSSTVRDRHYNDRINASQGLNFDHRSSVLDRQYRNESRHQSGVIFDRSSIRSLDSRSGVTRNIRRGLSFDSGRR